MSQKMSTMNIYLFKKSDISALLWISFLCNSINIFLSSFKLHYVCLFELRTFKTADEFVKNSLRPTSTVYSIWMSEWNGDALRRPAANTYAQRWWWRWRWNAVTTRPSDPHFYGLEGRREKGKGEVEGGILEKLHAFKLKFQTESRSEARNRPWIQKHRDNKPGYEQPHGCLLLLVALLFRPLAPGHIFLVSYHFYSQFAAANQQMYCRNTLRIRRVALCSFVRKCSLPVYFREILEELP